MYEDNIVNSRNSQNVSVIPATKRFIHSGGQLKQQTNIRVAAYCRVSTGDESQQTSYTNQKAFYSEMIQKKSGWQFAGIYADEAISGTSRAHRTEFNRMMEDAKAGKLDYIVTKSISRFARNTVDTLNCVRELRQHNPPIGIYFEKENIDTLDATGELILTILSALAQDESRSISDNIRWTFQKNFQAGIPHVNLNRMLGYDKGEDGQWLINEEQAKTVRYIFNSFTVGKSANRLAKELNQSGRKTVNGKDWRADTVLKILRNEKYVGDLEMQKTVTKDFLTHRSIINRGEAPKYYVENHHEGIVDRVTWNKVQAILHEKSMGQTEQADKTEYPKRGSPFLNLICGETLENGQTCGSGLFRQTYTGTAKGYRDERAMEATEDNEYRYTEKYCYSYPVWRCKGKLNKSDGKKCPSVKLHECAIEQSFMEMLYALKRDYEQKGSESLICLLYKYSTAKSGTMQSGLDARKSNFEFFLKCLQALPEINSAGLKLNVYGLDVPCSQPLPEHVEAAPDFLPFERGIYCAFILKGKVRGDEIEYTTNFGVKLKTYGNRRTLNSFLGFRRADDKGTLELLDKPYKICGTSLQYRRCLRK